MQDQIQSCDSDFFNLVIKTKPWKQIALLNIYPIILPNIFHGIYFQKMIPLHCRPSCLQIYKISSTMLILSFIRQTIPVPGFYQSFFVSGRSLKFPFSTKKTSFFDSLSLWQPYKLDSGSNNTKKKSRKFVSHHRSKQ